MGILFRTTRIRVSCSTGHFESMLPKSLTGKQSNRDIMCSWFSSSHSHIVIRCHEANDDKVVPYSLLIMPLPTIVIHQLGPSIASDAIVSVIAYMSWGEQAEFTRFYS